jgi:SAM-dependent methyltransferase
VHESVRTWIAAESAGLREKHVLEIGSRDENGTIRDLFTGTYIGIDMRAGPSVDRVMDAHEIHFKTGTFDVVICAEVLEHDAAFWLTLAEAGRVLVPGGHLLLTTRGNGFAEHAYPSDYWRFMPASASRLAELAGCAVLSSQADPQAPGVFLHGVRS